METKKISVTVKRNKVFEDIAKAKTRYCVYKGSAGSGKSSEVAIKLIKKLSNPKYKGSNLLCVRKVEATNRDSTLAELKKAIKIIFGEDADRVWQTPVARTSIMYCKCLVTGAEIIFRGCNNAEDIEKIKSVNFENGKLTDVWIEEATEITQQDFEILDDRLRGILEEPLFYQINLTFNPVSATHWIKKRFFDFQDKNATTNQSTYKDNRFIDAAYYERMETRKILDPDGYRVYGLGEWGNVGGQILSNFEIKEFDIDQFSVRYYGQDFGYSHANAILDVGFKENDIYICREIYEFEKDMPDIIALAESQGWEKRIRMWCDSAEPDRIMMWRKRGFNVEAVKKGAGSIKGQIEYLKGIVDKDKVVKRKIYIHPSCVNTIKEIQQWRYKFDAKSNTYLDEPVDFQDDAMAALRYSIESFRQPQVKRGF